MSVANPTGYSTADIAGTNLFNLPHRVTAPAASQHRDATDTEAAACAKVAPVAGKIRAQVLAWIIEAGDVGATGKELGAMYARSIGRDDNDASARYSAMPRCTELRQLGMIRDSGRRRDGSIVWVASKGL